MGILDRINGIEMRMQEIQGRFGTQSGPQPAALAGQASFQAVMGNVVGTQMAGQAPATAAGTLPGMAGMPGLAGLPGMAGLPGATSMTGATGIAGAFPGLLPTAATAPTSSATPASTPSTFDAIIKEASEKYGVDQELIKAVIQQESAFNPNARSCVGAQGLMQLMPATAASLGVTDSLDPQQNIMGGTRYIKGMLERFKGDTRLALAAYNAGAGNVQKYGGIPPFAETQNYVQKIMANYQRMKGG